VEESLSSGVRDLSATLKMTNPIGYCIALETKNILHYCYPFYQLLLTPHSLPPNIGMGMMLKAIVLAKENGKKYIYLGSFQRPTDTYKLQFSGLEWFDGKEWQNDLEELKDGLKTVV
jgi:arginyl-tRNA--protein-N-Asp/Glu arginylyltransferase